MARLRSFVRSAWYGHGVVQLGLWVFAAAVVAGLGCTAGRRHRRGKAMS